MKCSILMKHITKLTDDKLISLKPVVEFYSPGFKIKAYTQEEYAYPM